MIPSFLLYAAMSGMAVALVAGPLGSFVVWRRMAYFGDAISHAALLGVAAGLLLQVDATIGIIASSLMMAGLLTLLQRETRFSSDTLLGILAHGALSVSIVVIALLHRDTLDLNAYLFGDILAVGPRELGFITGVCALVLAGLLRFWRPLLRVAINEDTARVEGLNVPLLRFMLMAMVALVVAVAIKIVGMLLITALLVLPAASARYLGSTPTRMAVLASLFGMVAVAGGLYLSFLLDTPSGPSIVVAALGLFLASLTLSHCRGQRA